MSAGRPPAPPVIVVAAVIERNGRFLVTRRLRGVHLEGYWEFPGGKCGPHESHVECLQREMREELDVGVVVGDEILDTKFAYPEQTVMLHFYRCEVEGSPRALLGQDMRWASRAELATLKFPDADAQLIATLART